MCFLLLDIQAAGLQLRMDERVKHCITQLVADGIYSVSEVQRHAKMFVKNQLFAGQQLPSSLNHRYFPTRRDIMNLIYRTRIAQMHSHVDQGQGNLLAKIEKWQTEQSDDKFLFRPYVDVNSSFSEESDEIVMSSAGKEGLLIVHQTT
jgi:hypothetical protein